MVKSDQITYSSWPFQVDIVQPWAYWDNAFSKEECERIVKIGNSYNLKRGTTFGENESGVSSGMRDSNIIFLQPEPSLTFVFKKLTDVVLELNSKYFNFDLFGFTESLQFTEYKAPGGKYDYHIDKSVNGRIRKLSLVLQLTDETTYEGGDFEIMNGTPEKLIRKQGTVLMIPSYTLHRVTPLTQGTRNSLVGWISGNHFK